MAIILEAGFYGMSYVAILFMLIHLFYIKYIYSFLFFLVHKNIYVQSLFFLFCYAPPFLSNPRTLILTLALKGWFRLRVSVQGKG